MTPEQRDNLRAGDILLCTKGNWHFSTGDRYTVYPLGKDVETTVVWCDDLEPHWTRTLDSEMFEVIKREDLREVFLLGTLEDNYEALKKLED